MIYDLFIYIVWKRKIFYILNNIMNVNERIQLQKMLQEGDSEDYTEQIRKMKHSESIKRDIIQLQALQVQNSELKNSDIQAYNIKCIEKCSFLYNNYTDIFHKMVNDELDLTIMTKLLVVLKLIEDEKVDQHEGSVMVGKVLKELYVDSATKRMDNLDAKYEADKPIPIEGRKVSWKEFKNSREETI